MPSIGFEATAAKFWFFFLQNYLVCLMFVCFGERGCPRRACLVFVLRRARVLPPGARRPGARSEGRPTCAPPPAPPPGMLWVHVTPNLQLANAAVGFSFTLLNLFCGYLKVGRAHPYSGA